MSLQSGRVRLHRLGSVAALLVCFAVVLNIGPFTKAPKRETVRPPPERSVASTPIARPQSEAGIRPDRSRSTVASPAALEPISLSPKLPARDRALVQTVSQQVSPAAENVPLAMPATSAETPDPAAEHAIVGVWAPDASTCSLRDFRDGLLPTIINTHGAWAGDTYCIFNKQKQTATGWRVTASCSNPREHWTADVRLTVKDDRLTWASKRGRQIYTRCAPDFVMTAAR